MRVIDDGHDRFQAQRVQIKHLPDVGFYVISKHSKSSLLIGCLSG